MSNHGDETKLPLVDLPLAVVTVREMGAVSVRFDGIEVPPPIHAEHWSRAQFGELLDSLTQQRSRTIRLEVRESDGSVFTEIIHARRGNSETADMATPSAPEPDSRRARRGHPPRLIEITGGGFIQGEDVLVAIPVSTAEGDDSGVARAVIDLDQLTSQVREVALIGYVSGRIVTERLP
ncbi:hypothetical protein [Leucobacter triazinivorans]|uniref:Uncharacterized protein n=1 Tax=Leucobacter triazinivorans TaxID=1784719 RepID=A0A4P6KE85_9MICO|nr:hypothetical protein [Leucobacter triazinivorans]QBE47704.1 hypothetical protein EVS81_01720 [Leucobacter triazinivorans]